MVTSQASHIAPDQGFTHSSDSVVLFGSGLEYVLCLIQNEMQPWCETRDIPRLNLSPTHATADWGTASSQS